jgi:hypothetical protein
MYPGECQTQQRRDRKADTMPIEEFEMIFDAVLQKCRIRRKKKQQQQQQDQKEKEQIVTTK